MLIGVYYIVSKDMIQRGRYAERRPGLYWSIWISWASTTIVTLAMEANRRNIIKLSPVFCFGTGKIRLWMPNIYFRLD